jgi:hypothetical protein
MNFKLIKYLLALCFIVGLASCSEDEQTDPVVGDSVTVELNIPSINSLSMVTRGMTDAKEKQIDHLHVLEFNSTNVLVGISPLRTISGTSFSYTITSRASKLVVLANVDDTSLNAAISVSDSYSDVQTALKVSLTGPEVVNGWDTGKSIPMWGESSVSGSTGRVSILLLRMLTRVNVVVDDAANFKLTSILLYNTNQGGFVIPTLPTALTDDTSVGLSNGIEYTDVVGGKTMLNEIYTFETASGTGAIPSDPCIVIGGLFGADVLPTYYRINFYNGAYLDIKRNHSYNFYITEISNPGYLDPDDAYKSRPINLKYVLEWEDNSSDVVIDGHYFLSVNEPACGWRLPAIGVSNSEAYKIVVNTNYPLSDLVIESSDPWLEFDIDNKNIYINVPDYTANSTPRDGTITIKAGGLRKVIDITQMGVHRFNGHNGWAGSNIYWNGTTLTFDDTPVDPANPTHIEKENWKKQGLYFQWGGFWGLDPSGPGWSGTAYIPSGNGYMKTTTTLDFVNNGMTHFDDAVNLGITDRERAYLYDITDGCSTCGDICKYLTEIGAAPGSASGKRWRMPTSIEFGDDNARIGDANRYYYYEGFASSPSSSSYYTTRDDGQAIIAQGAYKVENVNDEFLTGPRTFFPASGGRWDESDIQMSGSNFGTYRSSSAHTWFAYLMHFRLITIPSISVQEGDLFVTDYHNRRVGFPVRCVQY